MRAAARAATSRAVGVAPNSSSDGDNRSHTAASAAPCVPQRSSSPPPCRWSVSSVAMTTLSAPCAASVATDRRRSSSARAAAPPPHTTSRRAASPRAAPGPSTSSDTGSARPCNSSITHKTLAIGRLSRELPAVEDDHRAGHVRGGVRREVDDERPQLLRLPDAAKRDVPDDLRPDFDVVERVLVEVGAKISRRDRVDGDAVSRPLDGERLGEADDRVLSTRNRRSDRARRRARPPTRH